METNRREFIGSLAALTGFGITGPSKGAITSEVSVDLVIIGGGLGGCAAALAALRSGLRVVMTEETDWIGGQLTSQAVPPDEHQWIESHGANESYRELRTRIRDYYRRHYPLTPAVRQQKYLNPGNGTVSRLCHEPRVAKAVLEDWLAPYRSGGRLTLLTGHRPVAAKVDGDRVRAITVRSLRTSDDRELLGAYFVDATELGDILPLAKCEFVTGAESRAETGEMHAPEKANPANQQAFTMCFAMDYLPGEDHTIEKPRDYEFWQEFVPKLTPPWPGRLLDFTYTHPRSGQAKRLGFHPTIERLSALNLWTYRRIADARSFAPRTYASDISLVNWPQNDYFLGNLIGVSDEERRRNIASATQLSLSLLYWLQTEAPRGNDGTGFPGLRLRDDIVGTRTGVAKSPYVRESRRIRARFTVHESHVGSEQRAKESGQSAADLRAANFADSVGVGSYPIDLHPSTGGDNYIDFAALPFQIPLGALIPQRLTNLLPACKNIGVTHITGGCYRLHPVEWGIGEAVGCLVAFALDTKAIPHAIHESASQLADFQRMIQKQGVEIAWPDH